ncbi:MAG: hypothetical protein IKL97_05720 [Eggerthellaceae bacterium]|nr:hypothetical protein [Eggerthellaceae bacterium]
MQTFFEILSAACVLGGVVAGVAGFIVLFEIGVKAATVTFFASAALASWGAVVYMALRALF